MLHNSLKQLCGFASWPFSSSIIIYVSQLESLTLLTSNVWKDYTASRQWLDPSLIFAARFIWRQHSNMTTLPFHRKTCNDLFFLKITWFCVPWWFCCQVLIRRNAIIPCVINMKILFHLWNLILYKGSLWLVLFSYNKTSIQKSIVQFTMCLVRYCLLGCQWHMPVLTGNN